MKLRSLISIAALSLLSGLAAHAFPIAAPGTEGLKVIVAGTDDIIATYEGNSAAYSNDLYLEGFGFIFNNHSSSVGDTVNLGSYSVGTELQFRLHVNNTNTDYFTGSAASNVDGYAHARVESNWLPGTTLVSFEDLYSGPFDYNDLSFSFTNTESSEVPDGTATLALLTGSFAGLALLRRRFVK